VVTDEIYGAVNWLRGAPGRIRKLKEQAARRLAWRNSGFRRGIRALRQCKAKPRILLLRTMPFRELQKGAPSVKSRLDRTSFPAMTLA